MADPLDKRAIEKLRDLMAGDFGALMAAFVIDSAARMVDIEAALAGSNHDQLRRAAHSLKGMSLNLGAQPLAAVLADLEAAARAARSDAFPPLWEAVRNEYARARVAVRSLATR